MKVKDLIYQLRTFPKDWDVFIQHIDSNKINFIDCVDATNRINDETFTDEEIQERDLLHVDREKVCSIFFY